MESGGPNDLRQQRDDNEHLGLVMPSGRRALMLLGRALTVRCPYCGGRPVLVSWFKLRHSCGRCNRPLERGEHDYFLGGVMFNLVLSELLFAAVFVTVLVVKWPTVPWNAIQIGAPLGMAAAPILLYPISKLTWLAFDLLFRPESNAPETRGGRRA